MRLVLYVNLVFSGALGIYLNSYQVHNTLLGCVLEIFHNKILKES